MIILTALSTINQVFQALFYGDGSWLGVLLLLSIIVGLLLRWKYMGALLLPITIFLALDYLNHSLGWQSLIMFLTSTFIILYLINEMRR